MGNSSASSSSISKVPPKSSLDDLDTTKSMADLVVVIEDDDDDDETFAPHRTVFEVEGDPQGFQAAGITPAKKAHTESPMPQKALKSKSCKASCRLQDEWEEHKESRKGSEYKDMHYLMFEPVMKLE